MRILKFIVDQQLIKKDPDCDFTGLVPGTSQYLMAEFSFSPEWDKCVKVASFFSPLGREYTPQILKDGRTCIIPADALVKRDFSIRILGKGEDGYRLITDKVTVSQNGGK